MSVEYTYSDFISALKYLEDEGYIERFIDKDGSECVRICEGAENCDI